MFIETQDRYIIRFISYNAIMVYNWFTYLRDYNNHVLTKKNSFLQLQFVQYNLLYYTT